MQYLYSILHTSPILIFSEIIACSIVFPRSHNSPTWVKLSLNDKKNFKRFFWQDILKFMLLFIVVIGSFMVGLHNLYWYYSVHDDIEITDHAFQFKAEKYFGTYDLFLLIFYLWL